MNNIEKAQMKPVTTAAVVSAIFSAIFIIVGAVMIIVPLSNGVYYADSPFLYIGAILAFLGVLFVIGTICNYCANQQYVRKLVDFAERIDDKVAFLIGNRMPQGAVKDAIKQNVLSVIFMSICAGIFGFGVGKITATKKENISYILCADGLFTIYNVGKNFEEGIYFIGKDQFHKSKVQINGNTITMTDLEVNVVYTMKYVEGDISAQEVADKLQRMIKTSAKTSGAAYDFDD